MAETLDNLNGVLRLLVAAELREFVPLGDVGKYFDDGRVLQRPHEVSESSGAFGDGLEGIQLLAVWSVFLSRGLGRGVGEFRHEEVLFPFVRVVHDDLSQARCRHGFEGSPRTAARSGPGNLNFWLR